MNIQVPLKEVELLDQFIYYQLFSSMEIIRFLARYLSDISDFIRSKNAEHLQGEVSV
jgi:hypothetical protein